MTGDWVLSAERNAIAGDVNKYLGWVGLSFLFESAVVPRMPVVMMGDSFSVEDEAAEHDFVPHRKRPMRAFVHAKQATCT
jgi:hypothetical protein